MKYIYISLLISLVIACKDKNPKVNTVNSVDPPVQVEEIPLQGAKMLKPDANFIESAKSQKPNADLTDQIWHYSFALSIKEETPKENIYKGHWLDLMPGGVFKKGIYQDTTESGYYIFKEEGAVLELRSEEASSEWRIKMDPTNMLLIGTSTFGNNSWQIKLSRRPALPAKN